MSACAAVTAINRPVHPPAPAANSLNEPVTDSLSFGRIADRLAISHQRVRIVPVSMCTAVLLRRRSLKQFEHPVANAFAMGVHVPVGERRRAGKELSKLRVKTVCLKGRSIIDAL